MDLKADKEITLKKIFDCLKNKYKIIPKDVIYGIKPIYLTAIYNKSGKEK